MDTFQQSLLSALSIPGNKNPTITADVDALTTLYSTAPETLKRFLATSPSWRVFKEHGDVYATRRWMIGSEWCYSLHGYYTKYDTDKWSTADELLVEIFEQSDANERRMTKAALSLLNQELRPLIIRPDWNTIQNMLPDSSIKKREPVFNLRFTIHKSG